MIDNQYNQHPSGYASSSAQQHAVYANPNYQQPAAEAYPQPERPWQWECV